MWSLIRNAKVGKVCARVSTADTLLMFSLDLSFSTLMMVSALLFISVPIWPLAFSSPLFWWRIVWMWIWYSSVQRIRMEVVCVASNGALMSKSKSRTPSMMTSPIPSVVARAHSMISMRSLGVYLRKERNSRRSLSIPSGRLARARILARVFLQCALLCSVST